MLAAPALPAARSQREQTLPLAGTQVIAADPEWDCPEERYELRTCPCGSTLCKRVA